MSDVMLFGVLRMPYEIAMGSELSRVQFYDRVQEALDRMQKAEARVAELEGRATPPSPSAAEAERAAFVAWARKDIGMPDSVLFNWDADWVKAAFEGWKARAALATNAADSEAKAAERSVPAGEVQMLPPGWKVVPIEPGENMITHGFESWPDPFFSTPEEWDAYQAMTGCQQAAHRARLCWAAMLAAAPAAPLETDKEKNQ